MAAEGEQQIWLLNCLNAILDPDSAARSAAEDALSAASLQPGYGVALAKVTVSTDLVIGLRQLAAVLLKQYVKQHWQEGEKDYVSPIVSLHDKLVIRSLLPLALGDPHEKIQTAVGMAIASIALSDWPEDWPDLMVHILSCLNDRADVNKVNGAIRCLSLFSSEVDDKQLPHLIPVLFPALWNIVSTPSAYSAATRRQALIVLHSCIATLGVMRGAFQEETKALMSPMLKQWMEQFAAILASPVQSENPDDWGLKSEALKALMQIVQNFPKLAYNDVSNVVLGPLWQTFVSGYHIYEAAAIKGLRESFATLADSDGTDQSLEAFAIQLFEFLLTLIGNPRYRKVVRGSLKDLTYYAVGYIQITEEQVQTWSSDATEFLADEETFSCSCRSSGITLLQEIVESFGRDGVTSILEAVNKRLEEAGKLKSQGETGWWKLREAAIVTLGSCVNFENQENLLGFSLNVFVNHILIEDLSEDVKFCPFLYGRALWAAAKFASAITKDNQQRFFAATMDGLSEHSNLPIMIGSCQALSELLPKVDAAMSKPYLQSIFSTLGSLLQQAEEDTLHIVLEALQSAIKADEKHAAEIEAVMSPLLLNVWVKFIADPLIGIDALDTLEVLKNVPGCLEPLAARILPSIAGILSQFQSQEAVLVAGAIDLLTMLLKNAPLEVIRHAYNAVFCSIIGIVLQTDDHTSLQSATECLAGFVKSGGENLLKWNADANSVMKMLLDAAARLLNPETESSASLYSGTFIVQLIEQLSSHMAPYLRDLTAALVARLESVNLKGSLIFAFAKLVHMSAPNYGQFIELLLSIPSKSYGNGLNCVMSEWTKNHGEIQGSYQIKVSTTALTSLLVSGHPALSQVSVEGHLIQSTSGIKTRSRAKVQPDQFTIVSLPQKIFSLLAEAIVEGQEAATNCVDEDDDWEEVDDAGDEDQNGEEAFRKSLSSSFQPAELFQDVLNEEIDELEDDEPFYVNDPINQINLQVYLVDFMKRFSSEAPAAFGEMFKGLSDREKSAVEAAMRA